MAGWTQDELTAVGESDELEIAPAQDSNLRRATPIWVVRVGDQLFVRSHRGRRGRWYQRVQVTHRGRISAGGLTKDVELVDAGDDAALNEAVDAAYMSKYQRYGSRYVDPMLAATARQTTLKLVPR